MDYWMDKELPEWLSLNSYNVQGETSNECYLSRVWAVRHLLGDIIVAFNEGM